MFSYKISQLCSKLQYLKSLLPSHGMQQQKTSSKTPTSFSCRPTYPLRDAKEWEVVTGGVAASGGVDRKMGCRVRSCTYIEFPE